MVGYIDLCLMHYVTKGVKSWRYMTLEQLTYF